MNAARDLPMPKLGLTMTEGLIAEWKIAAGDAFAPGDIMFVVETEKIANEVAAETAGVLDAILVEAGATAPVGAPIARILAAEGAETAAAVSAPPSHQPSEPASAPPVAASREAHQAGGGARIIATPLARRLARQSGVDLASLNGSGPGGRVKAADVEASLGRAERVSGAPAASAKENAETRTASAAQTFAAKRLTESVNTIPHFHLFTEADVGALLTLRRDINARGDWPKLTITPFVIAAVARAFADRPELNVLWRDGTLVQLPGIDVAVAVDTPRGLVVPRLRGVDRASVGAIASDLAIAAQRARGPGLGPGDMAGGVVAVSSLGAYAVTHNAPIIDPDQSFILGVGRVRDVFRPDEEGRPVARAELGLVLAADHRVVNGAAAARLLEGIVSYLETPLRLLTPPVI